MAAQFKAIIHDHNLPGPNRDEETTGPESLIVEKYTALYPEVYFEQQPDNEILIFRSEKEARSKKNNIGKIIPGS